MDLQPDKASFRHAVVEIRDLNSIDPGLDVVALAPHPILSPLIILNQLLDFRNGLVGVIQELAAASFVVDPAGEAVHGNLNLVCGWTQPTMTG